MLQQQNPLDRILNPGSLNQNPNAKTPLSSMINDPSFARNVPQPNVHTQQKVVDLGVNYFSSFKGQKVIVTGASKGVGRAVAKALLDAGAYVACVARSKVMLDSLVKYYPSQAFAFAYDLSDPDEINICFKKIIESFRGELDIIIHCAGSYFNKEFENVSIKDWDECMNINTRSIVHLTSLAVPFLELSKGNKSVVILTSNHTDKPLFGEMLFAVSKSMTNMFIECLALELADAKIRVNGVGVSALNTTFRVSKDGVTEFENKIFLEHVAELKPLKTDQKLPEASNVADTILWLASNDSSFVTGEILKIDDGMSLTSAFPKPKSRIV